VVEMEAAAVMQVARNHGVRAGCLLAVTDLVAGERVRADFERVEDLGLELGETAWAALTSLGG
jgi:nucleoside phosphorylase